MRFPHATFHLCRTKGKEWTANWFDKKVNKALGLGMSRSQVWAWINLCAHDKTLDEYRKDFAGASRRGRQPNRTPPSPPQN